MDTQGNTEWMRVPEAAELLGLPRTRTYELIQRGELPAVRIGERSIRVNRSELERFLLESRRVEQGTHHGLRAPDHATECRHPAMDHRHPPGSNPSFSRRSPASREHATNMSHTLAGVPNLQKQWNLRLRFGRAVSRRCRFSARCRWAPSVLIGENSLGHSRIKLGVARSCVG